MKNAINFLLECLLASCHCSVAIIENQSFISLLFFIVDPYNIFTGITSVFSFCHHIYFHFGLEYDNYFNEIG
jgi:hypothetical protein